MPVAGQEDKLGQAQSGGTAESGAQEHAEVPVGAAGFTERRRVNGADPGESSGTYLADEKKNFACAAGCFGRGKDTFRDPHVAHLGRFGDGDARQDGMQREFPVEHGSMRSGAHGSVGDWRP